MKAFFKESLGLLDVVAWVLVVTFFCGSALLFDGNLTRAALGAMAIIVEMFILTIAIEIIIECLKKARGIGTITGFITNGPETVVLLVGLVAGDIIFAAATPLGSNFINPLLLFCAAILTGKFFLTITTKTTYIAFTCFFTAFIAGGFFFLEKEEYLLWLGVAMAITTLLFFIRPKEEKKKRDDTSSLFVAKVWLPPAILALVIAGYLLDPVVNQAAEASHAPKGLIGFVVLSTLTSWPEFKSCIALLKRDNPLAAILNIAVSNITNIWLAAAGVVAYLFSIH